jgi:hypothetical protein
MGFKATGRNLLSTPRPRGRPHDCSESRELRISLPEDAPAGEAEVIVLFGSEPVQQEARTFEQRFPPNPRLTGVVFLEDPTAPVGEDDWPTEADR